MQKKAAIYARVSTAGQTIENQLLELRAVAERAGWTVTEEFTDEGISGAKGRDKRPAFDKLCKGAAQRKFDVIMVWSVDRIGRSLQHLIAFLEDVHASGVGLYLHQQGVDTTTPGGKALFQMMGVFAEFERAMIQERIRAGLKREREPGKKPPGKAPLPEGTKAKIRAKREQGMAMAKIAKALKISVGSVHKTLKQDREGQDTSPPPGQSDTQSPN